MKCGAGNFQLQLPPNVRLQGLLRGETWLCHVSPLNNPFGPSSLMPQSEMNRPAHLHERKFKLHSIYIVIREFYLHYKVIKITFKMKICRLLLVLSAILLIQTIPAKAAHIIGGHMNYKCLGGDEYEVVLVLYRDCSAGGAPFDSAPGAPFPGTVSVYEGDAQTPLVINGKSFIELPAPVVSLIANDGSTGNCTSSPSTLCIEQGVYTFNVLLPSTIEPIHIVYQRCCRQGTSTNIHDPGSTGMTFIQTVTPQSRNLCNNSPVFNKNPMACAEIDLGLFFHDHSAVDAEGDSLVYSFCAPFTGGGDDVSNATGSAGVAPNPDAPPPYSVVDFITPFYTAGQPIPGSPAYLINSSSGVVIGQGSIQGKFIYGVCVEEYRGGVLLGNSRFEFVHSVVGTPLSVYGQAVPYEELRVFPNPTNGVVTLELPTMNETFSIEIFDLNGRLLLAQKKVQSTGHQIDISDFSTGIYCIKAFNKKRQLQARLVVLPNTVP